MDYLFAYGTLRKDYDLPLATRIRDHLRWVGTAKIGATLYDLGRYPGAVRNNSGQEVIGDVFLLDDPERILRLVDRYEGVGEKDAEFIRKKNRVTMRSGRRVNVWVYWYNRDPSGKLKIRHKDYLNYLKHKSTH